MKYRLRCYRYRPTRALSLSSSWREVAAVGSEDGRLPGACDQSCRRTTASGNEPDAGGMMHYRDCRRAVGFPRKRTTPGGGA